MRILITGSRNWTDEKILAAELLRAIGSAPRPHTIVVGDCPTGVDKLIKRIARMFAFQVETHVAHWNTHGSAAGPIRNQGMVNSGADKCLGFPLGESRGTRDCIRRARKAGIPVTVHEGSVNL